MRFGIGRISHESNTFARDLTRLEEFQAEELVRGGDVLTRYDGTNSVIGGAIAAAADRDVELIPIIGASAVPGPRVEAECFQTLTRELCGGLVAHGDGMSGVLLDLHGAMVAEHLEAADEQIVRGVREFVGDTPIVVVLDSHANLTAGLVQAADIVLGYTTYPHVDLANRGQEACLLLVELACGALRVEAKLEQVPALIPLPAQYTSSPPMSDLHQEIKEIESSTDIVDISLFGGFPHADTSGTGASIVATAIASSGAAGHAASAIREQLWERRAEFSVAGVNVEEAVHEAMAAREGPVVLADLGDNPGAGGPCDGTTLLWALLDLGVRDATLAVIADEQAVEACVNAGTDARIEIPLGGRRDTRHGYPIDVRGKVKAITDGHFTLEGPMAAGVPVEMGRTVLLELEARHEGVIEVIVTERRFQPFDLNVFRHVGIEPADRKILALKSSVHFRAAFEPIASAVHQVITPGITTPDPAFFAYQNVRRPIFPLDAM